VIAREDQSLPQVRPASAAKAPVIDLHDRGLSPLDFRRQSFGSAIAQPSPTDRARKRHPNFESTH